MDIKCGLQEADRSREEDIIVLWTNNFNLEKKQLLVDAQYITYMFSIAWVIETNKGTSSLIVIVALGTL